MKTQFFCKPFSIASAVLLLLVTAPTFASKTIYERIDYSRGTPEETVQDMRVKVLGGEISIERRYRLMRYDRASMAVNSQ